MKKIIFFLLIFASMVNAFSFSDLFNSEHGFTGRAVNDKDPSVTLSRPVDTQAVNNPVVFKWRYFDPEDDKLEYSILQVDDDSRFFSPQNYQIIGEEFTLTLKDEGDYYWRVQVVNEFGESLSDIWSFHLNPEMKVCSDGTPYFECSINKPFYCEAGELENDCQRCGCSSNGICQIDGSCLIQQCNDGTEYGACGFQKPKLCLSGALLDVCNICGCPAGLECMSDGRCQAALVEPEPEPKPEPALDLNLFERFVLFMKGLFGRA